MTTARQTARPPQIDSFDELCPGIIMRWPGLSTESKLTWVLLWARLGRRPGSMEISFPDIAYRLGRTEGRARQWISKLTDVGLVERIDGKRGPGGSVLVYLPSPTEVARIRKIDHPDSDQLGLFDDPGPDCDQSDNSVGCESGCDGIKVSHPKTQECQLNVHGNNFGRESEAETDEGPRVPPEIKPSDVKPGTGIANLTPKKETISSNLTPNSMVTLPHRSAHPHSHPTELSRQERGQLSEIERRQRGTSGPPAPQAVGQAVVKYLENHSPEKIKKQRDEIKAAIIQSVRNDPKLSGAVVEHIAGLVQSGEISRKAFGRIITLTMRGKDGFDQTINCRRMYLIGSFKKLCANRGLDWPFKKGN